MSCFAPHLFNGRKVLITGASRGIGAACARAFAELGADLALLSKSAERLTLVTEQLKKIDMAGRTVSVVSEAVDITDPIQLAAGLKRIQDKVGTIDILVNNAGIYITEEVQAHRLEKWQRTIDTNLTSAMVTSSQLVGAMVAQKWGRVINISSLSGKVGEAYGAAYSASKFGLLGLTQSLALEVAASGVTANAICPGWVATDMAFEQINDAHWCELNGLEQSQSLDIAKFSVPQQRLIDAEEVASLVIYLATDAARGITGQSINICGGLSIH